MVQDGIENVRQGDDPWNKASFKSVNKSQYDWSCHSMVEFQVSGRKPLVRPVFHNKVADDVEFATSSSDIQALIIETATAHYD